MPQNNFHGVQADERVPLYYDIMFMCASDNNNDNMPMMMMMIITQLCDGKIETETDPRCHNMRFKIFNYL